MSRYLLTFYKVNDMRFISHLDVQRLFKRAVKRARIELVYSQGYNPHPKMNIVQPLSLGFESSDEYFEMTTVNNQNVEAMIASLNETLPEGIRFTKGKDISDFDRNISSCVEYAGYEVEMPCGDIAGYEDAVKRFCSQKTIIVNKYSAKRKTTTELDIAPLICEFNIVSFSKDTLILKMVLRSASNETLNPLIVLEKFCSFTPDAFVREQYRIRRTDLLASVDNRLISLFDYGMN